MPEQAGVKALRMLYDVAVSMSSGEQLAATLQAVADGVVQCLDFGAAVVNYRLADGDYEVLAVAGPPEAATALLGVREAAEAFDAELAHAEHWGRLRYVPHQRYTPGGLHAWVPDSPVPLEAGAWHPLDALYAPLTSFSGELVGIVSVDLPAGGRRPDGAQRRLLELFAMHASVAIVNAKQAEELRAERAELAVEHTRLQAGELAFRLAFEGAANGMAIVGLGRGDLGRFLRVNDALCALYGYSRPELLACGVLDVVHVNDSDQARASLAAAATGAVDSYRVERRYQRPDGTSLWLLVTTAVIRAGHDQPPFMLVHAEDHTALKATESQLRHTADHDPLTGLVNRRVLLTRLAAAQERARDTGLHGAVLFCDLDDFKHINDRHGHARGDQALQHTARRLLGAARQRDTVARLGGDEFAVLAEDITLGDLAALIERIHRAVAQPLPGSTTTPTISVGSAPLTRDTDAERLLHSADIAMYKAKATRQAF